MVNKGTDMTILENTTVFIPGNYQSDDTEALEDDSPLILNGTLLLGGNLINNSTGRGTIFRLIDSNGRVILNGTGDQQFRGKRIEFADLTINKSMGLVELSLNADQEIQINGGLTFTSGDLDLNGFNLSLTDRGLANPGRLDGESGANQIFSTTGGSVILQEININSTAANARLDVRGMGLGIYRGTYTGIIEVERNHQSIANVGNGSIGRSYRITSPAGVTDPNWRGVDFDFFNNELSGLAAASLSIYLSNDNGVNWRRIASTRSGNTYSVDRTLDNIPIAAGNVNLITLAEATCSAANRPNVTFTYAEGLNPAVDVTAPTNMRICEGGIFSLTAPTAAFIEWTLPDNSTSNVINLTDLSEEGVYSLFVRNSRGCESTNSITINVIPTPTASFTVSPNNSEGRICVGHEISFDGNNSMAPESTISGYDWTFGDGGTDNSGQIVTNTYTSEGTYEATLTVTNADGCQSTTVSSSSLTVLDPPTLSFEMSDVLGGTPLPLNEICQDETVFFESTANFRFEEISQNLEGLLDYSWDFGNGTTDNMPAISSFGVTTNTSEEFSSSRTITLSAEPRETHFSCAVTEENTLTVLPKPSADFQINLESTGDQLPIDNSGAEPFYEVCQGLRLAFADLSSIAAGGSIGSYLWDFGDGTTSTEANPTHLYSGHSLGQPNEVFLVQLTVTSLDGCASETDSFNLRINPAPVGGFTTSANEICEGQTVTFTNATTIPGGDPQTDVSYLWDFGDGNTSTDFSPIHTFVEPIDRNVTLTVTSLQGCTNQVIPQQITVNAIPESGFEIESTLGNDITSLCDGETFFFSTTSFPDATYLWDFGDGNTSEEQNPTHTYDISWTGNTASQSFNVSLVVTGPGISACSSSMNQSVTVDRLPSVNFPVSILSLAADTLLDPANLANAFIPPGSSFEWRNNEGTVVANTRSFTVSNTGSYTLSITSPAPENCLASTNITVSILEPADLGGDQNVCDNGLLNATPSNVPGNIGVGYEWFRNNIRLTGETDPTLVITQSGLYRVRITYSGAGGIERVTSDESAVSISDAITLNLDEFVDICPEESATLNAGIAGAYEWRDPSGTLIADTREVTVTDPGPYTLTVTSGACSDQAITTVRLRDAPAAGFLLFDSEGSQILDDQFCFGETVVFESFQTEGTISWDFDDGSTEGNVARVTKEFNSARDFDVTITTLSADGCPNSFTNTITVSAQPEANFQDVSGCLGEVFSFQEMSTGADLPLSYVWDFGDGAGSTSPDPTHEYIEAGSYVPSLQVTSSAGCISETVSGNAVVHQNPSFSLPTRISCSGSIVLDPTDDLESLIPTGTHFFMARSRCRSEHKSAIYGN